MTKEDFKVLKTIFVSQAGDLCDLSEGLKEHENSSDFKVDFIRKAVYLGNSTEWKHKRIFDCIENTDGSIRWIWPKENKRPDFLKFYTAMSLKSMVYEKVLKVVFYIPFLRNLFIKSFCVYSNEDLFIDQITYNGTYALFTGTVGPNRKIVVFNRSSGKKEFLKIPLGNMSFNALKNEYTNSELFKGFQDYFQTPNIQFQNGVLSSSDLEISTSKSSELLTVTQTSLIHIIDNTISNNKKLGDALSPLIIVPKKEDLNILGENFNQLLIGVGKEDAYLSLNHGDFTPWNCFQDAEPVKLFDLEFASNDLPIYYDALHFWVQYAVMCTALSFDEVKMDVNEKWNNSLFKDHSKHLGKDFENVWRNYVLFISSHYHSVYSKQDDLHEQGKKLIRFLTYFLKN